MILFSSLRLSYPSLLLSYPSLIFPPYLPGGPLLPYPHTQSLYNTLYTILKNFLFTHLNLNSFLWMCCPLCYPLDHTSTSYQLAIIIYNKIFYYSSQATLCPNILLFIPGHSPCKLKKLIVNQRKCNNDMIQQTKRKQKQKNN